MLCWKHDAMLILVEDEANIEPLTAAGYRTMLAPAKEAAEPLPAAEHYVVIANGSSKQIALTLMGIEQWRISVNECAGYQDLTHAEAEGGIDLVRKIVRESRSLNYGEIMPFSDVVRPKDVKTYPTGWKFLDPYVRYRKAELIVVLGPYRQGKSQLAQILACDFADKAGREQGATAGICAWEDEDWIVQENIERFARSREEIDPMKGGDVRVWDLLARVHKIWRPATMTRDFSWFKERAFELLMRENCRFFVFDPWNLADHVFPRSEVETQYVDRMLKELGKFVEEHQVIVVIVHHVGSKTFDDLGDVKKFTLASAHGSSNFGKQCHRGICVARSSKLEGAAGEDRMILLFDKAKVEKYMGKRDILALDFDPEKMDFIVDPVATRHIKQEWKI
jgi:hypothetical protein